jgi:23S rRNA (guanosine2251-2'-O)-methyltransferase
MQKPTWVVEKERNKRLTALETFWIFGLHAVRDALLNPRRTKLRLVITKNAFDRLADAITGSDLIVEITDPRKFSVPIDLQSVHQGAALEVKALDWGPLTDLAAVSAGAAPVILLLDRVTDPHNVGAILRSAEVFGALAVIAPHRHSAPESGALAKSASGALERQPYLRVKNLANTMETLKSMGYFIFGLDGDADITLMEALGDSIGPTALVLGAEGPGLRDRTKETCDGLAKINSSGVFGSLNVSNAAAVGLFAVTNR